MGIGQLGELAAFFSSPIAVIILTFYVYGMSKDLKELRNSIHENGFVKKDIIEEKFKVVDTKHNNIYEDIRGIQSRLSHLERME